MEKIYDFSGPCPQCGGTKFFLSGFANPLGGKNGCFDCGYIPTIEDKLGQRVAQLERLLAFRKEEIAGLVRRITLRNRQIRSLRRALRN